MTEEEWNQYVKQRFMELYQEELDKLVPGLFMVYKKNE